MNIDIDEVIESIQEDAMEGFCHNCGYCQSYCEPDARNYECEECGENKVFGAEETLLMLG